MYIHWLIMNKKAVSASWGFLNQPVQVSTSWRRSSVWREHQTPAWFRGCRVKMSVLSAQLKSKPFQFSYLVRSQLLNAVFISKYLENDRPTVMLFSGFQLVFKCILPCLFSRHNHMCKVFLHRRRKSSRTCFRRWMKMVCWSPSVCLN